MSIHLTIKNKNCSNLRAGMPKIVSSWGYKFFFFFGWKQGCSWSEKLCEKGSVKQTTKIYSGMRVFLLLEEFPCFYFFIPVQKYRRLMTFLLFGPFPPFWWDFHALPVMIMYLEQSYFDFVSNFYCLPIIKTVMIFSKNKTKQNKAWYGFKSKLNARLFM